MMTLLKTLLLGQRDSTADIMLALKMADLGSFSSIARVIPDYRARSKPLSTAGFDNPQNKTKQNKIFVESQKLEVFYKP